MLRVTPQERQALGVTALLLLAGAGVRLFGGPSGPVEWEGIGADTLFSGTLDSVARVAEAERERERIRSEPLAPGERIDPNRADALQLDRLPRVGPALAERIVAWRHEKGPFRSLADLQEVPGIGPSLIRRLEPLLTLPPAPPAAPARSTAAAPVVSAAGGRSGRIDVNRASAEELQTLPGIGPALAERIVASRQADGPFRTMEELERVPGIGPVLRQRLAPLVDIR